MPFFTCLDKGLQRATKSNKDRMSTLTDNIVNVDVQADLNAQDLPVSIQFAAAFPTPEQIMGSFSTGVDSSL